MSGIATHIEPLTMFIMVIIITIFSGGRMDGVGIYWISDHIISIVQHSEGLVIFPLALSI